jgi:hypothetical protein
MQLKDRLWTTVALFHFCNLIWGPEERCLCHSICLTVKLFIAMVRNENIAQMYIDTVSQKLKKVKALIIICQTSNQIAKMK